MIRGPKTWCCQPLVLAFGVAVLLVPGAARAQQDTARASLAGPDQVEAQLEADAEEKSSFFDFGLFDPFREWKAGLMERHGLGVGVDYSTVFSKASASLGEDNASSGMVRVFGSWELVGRGSNNSGAFVFKIEHRHRYATVAPSGQSFTVGYAGIWSAPFSDQKLRATNLYWRQRIANGRMVLVAGFLDATDFVDVYGLASPWLHFSNLTFSTGSSTIGLPNDALLGLGLGAWLSDHVYAIGSIGDNASDPTKPFTGFDRVINVREYFKSVELGWTTSPQRAYFDNVHVTFWHSDQKSATGDPEGWGLNASVTRYVADKWMPFLRGGYAKDGGSLLQKSVSAGVGHRVPSGEHLVALGLNWGQPNESTFGPGLSDQYGAEVFWRWQLGTPLAVTPSLQLLINPALNPNENTIWVFGLRARFAL